MTSPKGRRLGATIYAPRGTSTGDTPSVAADGTIDWGPPSGSSTNDTATRSDAIAAGLAAESTARMLAGTSGTLDDYQVQLTAQFYGA